MGVVAVAFRLPLAPPETLGRRFQYALFSLNPSLVDVDEAKGVAVFQSPGDYLELVSEALKRIRSLVTGQKPRNCRPSVVQGVNCCMLHRGPALYAAGRRGSVGGQRFAGDYLLLAQSGLTQCLYTTSAGKATPAWTHAALSYADRVIQANNPLGGHAGDLPWLAKATIFGRLRVTGGGRQYRAQTPTLDTLGSVLLGGAISFLGSQRLGDSMVEFLLVPDSPHDGYRNLRDLMLPTNTTVDESTASRAAGLANRYSVSLEVALSIVLAVDLANKLAPASQMSAYETALELEKAATLVTVTPQQRPMIRSVIPLSIAVYAAYEKDTLNNAMNVAFKTPNRNLERVQGLRNVIGACLGSMYLQAMNCRGADHLSACIRNLHTAADSAESEGLPGLARILRILADKLSGDYKRMLTGAVRAC